LKLIIFDIDGTIINSVKTDGECFIQTFNELHKVDLANTNWFDFKNVTDAGLTIEIFEQYLNRIPSEVDIQTIKMHFYKLLKRRIYKLTEIKGALSFIKNLSEKSDVEIGFATGGWKETATLKCKSIGFELNDYILKSSNDHFNRATIIEFVIKEALIKNKIEQFEAIFYFGDGLWDFNTTIELGINFIGVDCNNNKKLQLAGADKIIQNYTVQDTLWNWIDRY